MFAEKRFSKEELLLRFAGPRVARRRLDDFTHAIQVGRGVFLGPSGDVDDYVNHSCEPNAGVRTSAGGLDLIALRTIRAGEEITFDYSTCMVDEPEIESCACGSSRCRGRVSAFRHLPAAVQARYARLGVVPDFAGRSTLAARARRRRTG